MGRVPVGSGRQMVRTLLDLAQPCAVLFRYPLVEALHMQGNDEFAKSIQGYSSRHSQYVGAFFCRSSEGLHGHWAVGNLQCQPTIQEIGQNFNFKTLQLTGKMALGLK